MKAIILAAGYGTRLYPLTLHTPKPLLTVGGSTILDRTMQMLTDSGIDDIHIVTNQKFFDTFNLWAVKYRSHASKTISVTIYNDGSTDDANRRGPIGDILFTCNSASLSGDMIIVAGDNVFNPILTQMISLSREKESSILAVYDLKDKSLLKNKFGVVLLDAAKRLISFEEKPDVPMSSLAATALYLLKGRDIEIIKKIHEAHPEQMTNSGDMIKVLLQNDVKVNCVPLSEWFDIGSHDDLKIAQEYYLKRELH